MRGIVSDGWSKGTQRDENSGNRNWDKNICATSKVSKYKKAMRGSKEDEGLQKRRFKTISYE